MKDINPLTNSLFYKALIVGVILSAIFLPACQSEEITSSLTPTSNSEVTNTPTEKAAATKDPTPTRDGHTNTSNA